MPIYNLAYWSQNRPWISWTPQTNSHILQMTTYKISTTPPEPWTPWANTLVYYDFETDTLPTITNKGTWWSSMDGTASNITIQTLASWKKVAENTSNSKNNWIISNWTQTVPSAVTQWCWIKTATATNNRWWSFGFNWSNGIYLLEANSNGAGTWFQWYKLNPSPEAWVFFAGTGTSVSDGNWHLVTWTYDALNGNKFYVDGNVQTMSYNQWSTSSDPTALLAMNIRVMKTSNNGYNWSFVWQCWCYWLEDKSRTAQEISDYYNQTKWDYWIS